LDVSAKFNVVAPVAGATATVTVTTYEEEAGTETIYLVGVAAGVSGVPSKSFTYMDDQCAPWYSDGTAGGGMLCIDSGVDYIQEGGVIIWELEVNDALDMGAYGTYPVIATIPAGAPGGITVADEDVCDSDDAKIDSVTDNDQYQYICFVSDGDATKPFTVTVTVGSLTFTRKVGVIDEVASLSLTGPSVVGANEDVGAADNEYYGDAFVVTALDSVGNIIGNGGGAAPDWTADHYLNKHSATGGYWWDPTQDGDQGVACDIEVTVVDGDGVDLVGGSFDGTDSCEDDYLVNEDSEDGYFSDHTRVIGDSLDWENADSETYAVSQGNNLAYDLPANFCDEDSAGEIRKVTFTDATGYLKSNTVTVTCVEPGAVVTNVTASGAAGASGTKLTFTFTATDGAGKSAGLGETATLRLLKSWDATEASATVHFAGGTGTYKLTLPNISGAAAVSFVINDQDPVTAGNQSFTKTFNMNVTNALGIFTEPTIFKSSVKKGRAVAVFPLQGGKIVKFTVENANTGVVKTYSRKASAAGKAWYTIVKAGTYYVTAMVGDTLITETLTVKR
jgi:hypothetical protein